MNQEQYSTANSNFFELINSHGFEGMLEVFTTLLNEAMQVERSEFLSAAPYQRSSDRSGYANGFKPKTIATTSGKTIVKVPQVRASDFYPSALEKGLRSERALKAAMAEMYIGGVSTRKVSKIFEEMCGFEVSSTQVSRATKELDGELTKWRSRGLSEVCHLILDARYEKVRQEGIVQSCAVLVAIGVYPDGKRSIISVGAKISEAEVHWRDFLKDLVGRGMHGVQSITSDDHAGLRQAIKTVFPASKWQRCQTHLQRNATAYVTKMSRKKEVAEDIRAIFNAQDIERANEALTRAVEKYREVMPRLSNWMANNIPEGLTVFALPKPCWKKLRTSNCIERLNREIKRRTRVASIFPNEESLLRLVSAVCVEISDEWEGSSKRYINMEKE
jgi:putative transposase